MYQRSLTTLLILTLPLLCQGAGRYDGYPQNDVAGYGAATLESRVTQLERQSSGSQMTTLSQDIGRLQSELRQLRGAVEELRYHYQSSLRAQSESIEELERRNMALEERIKGQWPTPAAYPSGTPMTAPAVRPPQTGADQAENAYGYLRGATPAPVTKPTPPTAPPVVPGHDSAERKADYKKAFASMKAGKYPDAITQFEAFVNRYPTGELSDNAYYWLGEAYYVKHDFVAAQQMFRQLVANFPESAKVADANLKLAFIEYENGEYPQARTLLTELVEKHPDSSAARMAEKRLERMRLENR